MPHYKVKSITEDRYYFDGDNIIKYSNKPAKTIQARDLKKEAAFYVKEIPRMEKLINNPPEKF